MAGIDYSSDALNVLSRFYGSDVFVYVEGDDDIPFWRSVFRQVPGYTVAVEGLGGSEEVEKWVRRIETGNAKVIVARDADYKVLSGLVSSSSKVIYSFGYSIENSLYTVGAIGKVAELCRRAAGPAEADVVRWLEHFSTTVRGLVVLDATSHCEGLGVAVLGENCSRFMVSERSAMACPVKSATRVNQVSGRISGEAVRRVERQLEEAGGYSAAFIRGHFLASAVLKYVADYAGRNVSGETLFTNAMNWFDREIASSHPHREYYLRSAGKALDEAMA